MSFGSWGGESSYIQEGLRRYQEEQKRKQEEERQRQLAEQQRQASIVPPFMGSREPLVRSANPPNPITAIAKPLPMQVGNPLPRADTGTPQISYTPPPTHDETVQAQGPSTPLATVNPVTASPSSAVVPDRLRDPRAYQNMGNPSRVPPVGVIMPQGPRIAAGVMSPLMEATKPYLGDIPKTLEDIYLNATKNALNIPVIGDVAANMAAPFSSLLPDQVNALIQGHQATREQNSVPRPDEAPTTPYGVVLDRYKHNLFDKPAETGDQLLQQFAPAVYAAKKLLEPLGATAEMALTAPIPYAKSPIAGQSNTTLGELYAMGVRALNIYQDQRNADIFKTTTWPGKADARLRTDAQPFTNPLADLMASIKLASDDYYADLAPAALAIRNSSPALIAAAIAQKRGMAWHGIDASNQQFNDMLEYPAKVTEMRDQASYLMSQAMQEPDQKKREEGLFQAALIGGKAKELANTHPAQLFDKNANYWMAMPAEIFADPLNLVDAMSHLFHMAPLERRLAAGAKMASAEAPEVLRILEKYLATDEKIGGLGKNLDNSFTEAMNKIPGLGLTGASKAAVDARDMWRTLASLRSNFTTVEDIKLAWKSYIADPIKFLSEGIPVDQLTTPRIAQSFKDVAASAPQVIQQVTPPELIQQMASSFDIAPELAQAAGRLTDARASLWSQVTGLPAQEWFRQFLPGVGYIDELTGSTGFHNPGGLSDFGLSSTVAATKDLLESGATGADRLQVLVHELGHVFHSDLRLSAEFSPEMAKQWDEVSQWMGYDETLDPSHATNMKAYEKFAETFSNYIHTGEAPTPELKPVFERFRDWLKTMFFALKDWMPVTNQQADPQGFDLMEKMLSSGDKPPVFKVGGAQFGDYNAIKSYPTIQGLGEFIDQMKSLSGKGEANIGQIAAELSDFLARVSTQAHGVATLPGVPPGAESATTVLKQGGQATVQYLAQGRKMLLETEEMGLAKANKLVDEFRAFTKSGQEALQTPLDVVGNTSRSIIGAVSLNSNVRNLVGNFISNRTMPFFDGVFSMRTPEHALEYIQRVSGGLPLYDEIAKASHEINTHGSMSTVLGDLFSKVPGAKQIRRWRLTDEMNSKVLVYARTHEEQLMNSFVSTFKPELERTLKGLGWQNPDEIERAYHSLVEGTYNGGKQGFLQNLYALFNGADQTTATSFAPHYRDIYGQWANQLDDVLKTVRPENLEESTNRLRDIISNATSDIVDKTQDYLSQPGRTAWTNYDDQKTVAETQSQLKYLADALQLDYNEGVQAGTNTIGDILKQINEAVGHVVQMAPANENSAGHIFDLSEKLQALRRDTHSTIDRLGEELFRSGGHLPSEATPAADGVVQDTLEFFRQRQEEEYSKLGKKAMDAIEAAREKIVSGAKYLGEENLPGVLRDLGRDFNEVFDLNAGEMGPMALDPNRLRARDAGREGMKNFKTMVMTVLQQNPSQSGFDHFTSAMDNLGEYFDRYVAPLVSESDAILKEARDIYAQHKQLREAGDQGASKLYSAAKEKYERAYDISGKAWTNYYQFAYTRLQAAAASIVQAAHGVDELPKFVPLDRWGAQFFSEAVPAEMVGRNPRNLAEFLIKKPDGGVIAINQRYVPPDALAQWDAMSKGLYENLAGFVTESSKKLFENGTGAKEIDDMISAIRTATNNPVFDAVREDVARYILNPAGYGEKGHELSRFYLKEVRSIGRDIMDALPSVADRNAQAGATRSLGDAGKAVGSLSPIVDNILYGANHSAEKMTSFSLTDFINKYGPDSLMGVFAPYIYWGTRQGKNMLERILFQPRAFMLMGQANKLIQGTARKQNLPQRFANSVDMTKDFGVPQWPDGTDVMWQNQLPTFIPVTPSWIFQGFGDTDRANQAAEHIHNNLEANSWPTLSSIPDYLSLYSEIGETLGIRQPPWIKEAILALNHRSGEINLGDWGWLGQIAGLGYSAATGKYQQGLNEFFDPYKAARSAANAGFGIKDQVPELAAGQAAFENRPLLAETARDHPQAADNWTNIYQNSSTQDLLLTLLGGLGISLGSMNPKEIDRRQAQQLYNDTGFDPAGNPTGGRERTQMLDPTSDHYVAGLATGQAAYQVINEGPQRADIKPAPPAYPFLPTYDSKNIDLGVTKGDYLTKLAALFDKYQAADEAMKTQHPEWGSDLGNKDRTAWTRQQIDAQTAEKNALDAQYPDVAGQFDAKTPANLRGANPSETTLEAMNRLYRQAKDAHADMKPETTYPYDANHATTDGWNKVNDAYNAAVMSTFQGYLNDPSTISQSVFGRPLDTNGPMPGQPSPRIGPPSPVAAGQTTLAQPQPGDTQPSLATEASTPSSQYDSDFAAAEKANGLPQGLLSAVAQNESGYDPTATSKAGAQGLMQIMPKTWAEWAPKVGATDPNNAQDSIKVAAAYLAWLQGQLPKGHQDIVGLMTAYNMGIGNLQAGVAPSAAATAYANTIANAVSGNHTPTTASGDAPWQAAVIQGYGENPSAYKRFGLSGHDGIDFAVPVGTPLPSVADGTVAAIGYDKNGWGHYVMVDIGDKTYVAFGHLSETDVKQGQTVKAGDILGLSGGTGNESGNSSGAHLHLTVRVGGTTQANNVDPTPYLAQWGQKQGQEQVQLASAPPAVDNNHLDPSVTRPSAPTNLPAQVDHTVTQSPVMVKSVTLGSTSTSEVPNPVNLPQTAEQFVQAQKDKYKGPVAKAQAAQLEDAWAKAYDRINSTYPDDAGLFDQYKAINTEDRPDWKAAHPMIRALNFLVFDQEAWQQMEKEYGKGIMADWAKRPAYGGEGDDALSNYYHAKPDVFLVNAWISGRPEIHTGDYDPAQVNPYDLGKDFAEAKSRFGDDIWDIVKKYYQTDKFVKGGDNTAWIAFKTQYPQYDEWRKWWYEKMGDQAQTAGFGSGFRSFGSFSSHRGKSTRPNYINGVQSDIQAAPKYQRPSSNGDWRQYFDARVNVKNPRK